ncbi:MAG: LysM peptidoglycan-binding domain-containing protein [Bacteroidia bacterium]|nr:LysM peptidoglycan-binding domain-containing protein [Bacteroidia bacterium]
MNDAMVKKNLRDTIRPFFNLLFAGLILGTTPLYAQIGDLVFLSEDPTETSSSVHFVKSGETLFSISKKYDLPLERIKSLNGLTQNTIYPGQRLIVETSTPRSATARTAAPVQPVEEIAEEKPVVSRQPQENTRSLGDLFNTPTTNTTDATLVSRMRERDTPPATGSSTQIEKRIYYQVKKGDDLFSIADNYQVSPEEILEWNAISDLTPGQVIIAAKRYEQASTEDLQKQQALEAAEKARMARSQWEAPQSRGTSYSSIPEPAQTYSYRTTSSYRTESPRSNPTGNTIESGTYRSYTNDRITHQRFYAAHKTLAPGATFKMMIPNNSGFVEVEVVSRLDPQNPSLVALSPACLKILEGAGSGSNVTIMYE